MEGEKQEKEGVSSECGKTCEKGSCCGKCNDTSACASKGESSCSSWGKWHCGGSRRLLCWVFMLAIVVFFYCVGYHAGRWSGDSHYFKGYKSGYGHGGGMMIERIYYSPDMHDGMFYQDTYGKPMMWR